MQRLSVVAHTWRLTVDMANSSLLPGSPILRRFTTQERRYEAETEGIHWLLGVPMTVLRSFRVPGGPSLNQTIGQGVGKDRPVRASMLSPTACTSSIRARSSTNSAE